MIVGAFSRYDDHTQRTQIKLLLVLLSERKQSVRDRTCVLPLIRKHSQVELALLSDVAWPFRSLQYRDSRRLDIPHQLGKCTLVSRLCRSGEGTSDKTSTQYEGRDACQAHS